MQLTATDDAWTMSRYASFSTPLPPLNALRVQPALLFSEFIMYFAVTSYPAFLTSVTVTPNKSFDLKSY